MVILAFFLELCVLAGQLVSSTPTLPPPPSCLLDFPHLMFLGIRLLEVMCALDFYAFLQQKGREEEILNCFMG